MANAGAEAGVRPHAPDHRIDPVLIAPGILKSFQEQYSKAFAEDGSIGRYIKRPGIPCGREGLGLAEAGVHHNVYPHFTGAV